MVAFEKLFETVKECYAGLKVGINHNYWVVKINAEKVSGTVNNIIWSSTSSKVVNYDAKSVIDGFKVVGVGFGRTGTVRVKTIDRCQTPN